MSLDALYPDSDAVLVTCPFITGVALSWMLVLVGRKLNLDFMKAMQLLSAEFSLSIATKKLQMKTPLK